MIWHCQCDCGNECDVSGSHLRSGHTVSCGCQIASLGKAAKKDLTGKIFGKLTVIEDVGRTKNGRVLWRCKCECGSEVMVSSADLLTDSTRSCGCLQRERASQTHKINLTGLHIGNFTVIEEIKDKRYSDKSVIWDCKCDFCGRHKQFPSTVILHSLPYSCGCINLNSKGEKIIGDILTKNFIYYIPQYTFKDCINPCTGRKLYFDFYLPDYNTCIEYDGIQHFKEIGWADAFNFKNIQHNDNVKNQYCANNGIQLIRIPYTDFSKIDYDYLYKKINNLS